MSIIRPTIETKEDLISFVITLEKDFKKDKESWKNQSLEQFLTAMKEYTISLEELEMKGEAQPSWHLFAEMLLAGSYYE